MTSIAFARDAGRGRPLRVAVAVLLAALVNCGPTPERAFRQDSTFANWPPELASRAPALADGIERDFGERPRVIAFTGRDAIDVLFWNPVFWRNDVRSKELPKESLPLVQKTAKHVAGFVWTTFGRDAGINVIRITFIRVWRGNYLDPTREVPAQQVTANFPRRQLETGRPEMPVLGIVER